MYVRVQGVGLLVYSQMLNILSKPLTILTLGVIKHKEAEIGELRQREKNPSSIIYNLEHG